MGSERKKPLSGKSLWKPEEDLILKNYVEAHGEGKWATVSKRSGLMRGGKSCRLRWKNYLRPNIKHGGMSKEEEDIIIRMHNLIGNRWSLIAGRLPGRTDNEVKNYWNTHLNKNHSHQSKRNFEEVENQTKKKKKKQKTTRVLQPICREKRRREGGGSIEKREEEETEYSVTNQWIDNDTGMCYQIETPSPSMLPVDAAYEFDDAEQLISLLDSFFVYEAFGCTNRAGEEASMEVLRSAMAKL